MSSVLQRSPSSRHRVGKAIMNDKRSMIRQSSMEKIKRFNTFICSQQYVVLPALLSWLKCSQPSLQTSTENTIILFRSIIVDNIVYKFILPPWHGLVENLECGVSNVLLVCAQFCDTFVLLASVFYIFSVLIVLQLCFMLYMMYISSVPSGFVFLISCMLIIKYLFYKIYCSCCSRCQKDYD